MRKVGVGGGDWQGVKPLYLTLLSCRMSLSHWVNGWAMCIGPYQHVERCIPLHVTATCLEILFCIIYSEKSIWISNMLSLFMFVYGYLNYKTYIYITVDVWNSIHRTCLSLGFKDIHDSYLELMAICMYKTNPHRNEFLFIMRRSLK
jgi:hypothetical protein